MTASRQALAYYSFARSLINNSRKFLHPVPIILSCHKILLLASIISIMMACLRLGNASSSKRYIDNLLKSLPCHVLEACVFIFISVTTETTIIPYVVGKFDPRETLIYVPSSQYVITQFLNNTEQDAEYMQLWLAVTGANIIKLDHTFKVASKVRGQSGEQQWSSVFTLMNEHCQVLGQFACSSKSLAEVQEPVMELISRLSALSLPVSSELLRC
jgi:hypothetical protein